MENFILLGPSSFSYLELAQQNLKNNIENFADIK